ncbi:hypothetical protein HDA40_002809 [Hamadaea flava]|uniref:DUF1963 domain-containing protein n=1 Tax=Hamadaea flava TaxID=1742688 RepID=A0ABV8LGI3_9ACTN|nr:hypothetical protein [Hamadaea flava]MCP2324302.1 hypothetical protein [Hamadaea flava]
MHTPDPLVDVLAAFPELRALGRTATRLHPRPGKVGVADSHIGGPLLWPAAEPWPVCDDPHMGMTEVPIPADLIDRLRVLEKQRVQAHVMAPGEMELHKEIERVVGPGYMGFGGSGDGPVVGHRWGPRTPQEPTPLVAVAQLRAGDVPDLPRPGGADLLQVLWCPFEHAQDRLTGPAVRLYWRQQADIDIAGVLAEPPTGEVDNEDYLPEPCRLHPEQIVEYPYSQELPADLESRLDDWEHDYEDLVMAPGWKVGGYARWNLTDLLPTPCPECQGPTTLLLVIDSSEFDGGTYDRWRPVEEQHITWEHPDRLTVQEPTGVMVGRYGSLRVFVCPACPGAPFLVDMQ